MHSSLHFYWYTNLFWLVWSPQQEERTIKWRRNIKQSASWTARRLRSSINGVGEEPFPLSSCELRWSVREVKVNSLSCYPVWENICYPSPSEQSLSSVPHCLHRNYGLTAEEDKAASPKRDGFLAWLLGSFDSSLAAQLHPCLFGLTRGWGRCWGELTGSLCSVLILFTRSASCPGCSPSWVFHHPRRISLGALARIF